MAGGISKLVLSMRLDQGRYSCSFNSFHVFFVDDGFNLVTTMSTDSLAKPNYHYNNNFCHYQV